jgi:hypothetical protein
VKPPATRLLAILALATAGALAADPPAAVKVAYQDPDRFIDVGFTESDPPRVRAGILEELRRYQVRDAAERIPAGMRLEVTITQLDMAGAYRQGPGAGGQMRVIHDSTPPRIDLDFVLRGADGAVVREGRRQLRNSQFMFGSPPSSAPLRHERQLLADWLEGEFPPAPK